MPITFGSVGDIIAIGQLIKTLVDTLDNSRGSSAEYVALTRDLWLFERALHQVSMLSKTCDDSIELNALRVTTWQAVETCRESMSVFLAKIRKFERSLGEGGSGNVVKDAARKVQWQLTRKEEVERFRAELAGHYAAINMLLATAGV